MAVQIGHFDQRSTGLDEQRPARRAMMLLTPIRMIMPAEPTTSYSVPPRIAAISIVLFWLFYYVTVSLRAWIMKNPG